MILGVVFVPILIFSIILGIKSGFQNFKYPILANVDGITGFSFSRIKDFVNGTQYCISKNAMYNVGLTYYSTEMARNPLFGLYDIRNCHYFDSSNAYIVDWCLLSVYFYGFLSY